MACPACGGEEVTYALPGDLADLSPGGDGRLALCARCLSLRPLEDEEPDAEPDFQSISEAFPRDPDLAALAATVVGLLDSLALYRSELTALVARAEREGVDVLLLLDRLAAEPGIEPTFDVERRRHQLAQLV